MVDNSAKIEAIKKHVACIPDFPKPGIIFRWVIRTLNQLTLWRNHYSPLLRDIFSVLRDPVVFKDLRDVLVSTARSIHPPVECVTALDARGFLFGPLVALELQVPFVPIRKKGKLPGRVQAITYALEYGEVTFYHIYDHNFRIFIWNLLEPWSYL